MLTSEADVQAALRLAAADRADALWRNNVGAVVDSRGVPVRFGLANDTKALNQRLKSADLIGWTTVLVTPDMIGQPLAVFTSVECKEPGWRPAHSGARFEHEEAQRRWAELVTAAGGLARFSTGTDVLTALSAPVTLVT